MPSVEPTALPPFPVRLADMRAADQRFTCASEAERGRLYEVLTFLALLDVGERAALERRFPDELELEPHHPDAGPELRRTWDARAHDLVRCMLAYGDDALARKLELVGRVAPDDPGSVLALTATGSVVELGRPDRDGRRTFAYRPSPRANRPPMTGGLTLTSPMRLGDPLRLSGRNTSEVIVLAAG